GAEVDELAGVGGGVAVGIVEAEGVALAGGGLGVADDLAGGVEVEAGAGGAAEGAQVDEGEGGGQELARLQGLEAPVAGGRCGNGGARPAPMAGTVDHVMRPHSVGEMSKLARAGRQRCARARDDRAAYTPSA